MEANTQYGIRPWMQNTPEPARPDQSSTYEDYMCQQALAPTLGIMSEDQIRALQPPLTIDPFPNRFGYRTEPLGIEDMAAVDSMYERRDFTGRSSGYSGTSYPSLNNW